MQKETLDLWVEYTGWINIENARIHRENFEKYPLQIEKERINWFGRKVTNVIFLHGNIYRHKHALVRSVEGFMDWCFTNNKII